MFLEVSLLACENIGAKEGFSTWSIETSIQMHTKNTSLSHEFHQCKNCFVHLMLTNIKKQNKTKKPQPT